MRGRYGFYVLQLLRGRSFTTTSTICLTPTLVVTSSMLQSPIKSEIPRLRKKRLVLCIPASMKGQFGNVYLTYENFASTGPSL